MSLPRTLVGLVLLAAGSLHFVGPAVERASAAASLAEDFSAGTLPASLQSSSGTAATFAGDHALFGGASDPGRSYLGTIDTDFSGVGFVAEVTVTIPAGGSATQTAFFGLGVGSPNPFFSFEPSVVPVFYSRTFGPLFNNGAMDQNDNGVELGGTEGVAGAGTHRLRLVWDAATMQATFSIHKNYAGGPFVASATLAAVNGADNGFTAASSRIFFGGAGGTSFDDLVIIIDSDGDGLLDDVDACPHSDLAASVVIDGRDAGVVNVLLDTGCTIADLVGEAAAAAANHGQFVAAVASLTNDLKSRGIISSEDRARIQRLAANARLP